MKRFLTLLGCLVLMISGISLNSFAGTPGAQKAGNFVLAVFSQNVSVVEPVTLSYEVGDTVKEVLANSGYEFAGIENGFISAVEGVSGNYSIAYDNGEFALDMAADQVKTCLISERTDVNPETDLKLVEAVSNALKQMAAYHDAENHVQNYGNAQRAYKTLLTNLRTGSAETISENTTALKNKMKEYETLLAGTKRKVKVQVTQGGSVVKDAKLAFTDEYGNITEAVGNEISLRDGKYTFVITDSHKPYNYTTNVGKVNNSGNWKVVENYFNVSASSTSLQVKLPEGEWFGEITAETGSTALKSSLTVVDKEKHKITYYIADNFDSSLKLTVQKTEKTPEKTTAGTLSSSDIRPWVDYVYMSGLNEGKVVSDAAATANTNMASFASSKVCLNLVTYGMQGNTLKSEIKWYDDTEADATGNLIVQGYEIEIKRLPTLLKLDVKDSMGSSMISQFDVGTYEYQMTTISDQFTVEAIPYGKDYTVEVKAGMGTSVQGNTVKLTGDKGNFNVKVGTKDQSNVYTINLKKEKAVNVTLTMGTGVSALVRNASGSIIQPKTAGGNTYALVPGESYAYVGTLEGAYHTTANFQAAEGLKVAVATPEVKDVLSQFVIYDKSSSSARESYPMDTEFSAKKWNYIVQVPDVNTAAYIQANSKDNDYTYWVNYLQQHSSAAYDGIEKGWTKITPKTMGNSSATNLSRVLAKSGYSNELKLQMRRINGEVTYYQEFVFDLVRGLSLEELTVSSKNAGVLTLLNAQGEAVSFDREVFDYCLKVSADTQELILSGIFQNIASNVQSDGGYFVQINGTVYEELNKTKVPLDVNQSEELVEIKILHEDSKAISNAYKLYVKKQQPIYTTFNVTPEHAIVYMVNQLDESNVYLNEENVFVMMPDVPYTYTVSATGYKTMQVTDFVLEEREEGASNTENIEVVLEEAPESSFEKFEAQWPTFRADQNGNGVVSSKTPIKAEDAVLYWANKIGQGFDTGATGCPILVDGYLYTYAGASIVKVDTITGEVVASGKMIGNSSFAINSPTYAEGMLFVGLSNGRVQAFRADTLESLWVYTDPIGGQPNCSIEYFDGHIYTGFWVNEHRPANFVCISVTDEDPERTDEVKLASWRYKHHGFYWAGAYACEDFILVGTDDGADGYRTGYASVLSFDPKTGKLIDEIKLTGVGDLRSDIMFDENGTGDYYFTTKGGHFYRLSVNADGTFKNLMSLKLDNYANDDTNPPMSTCTPVIYNGRAYIGVSGTGQFSTYSGHNVTVIDLTSWSIAYTVRTQGYPQTSGLLTTAYEEETELVYVYFIDNYTPGKVRVIADKKGQTEPVLVTKEGSYDTAYVLFTPTGAQAQFAICSPIADENGVIYFKNDSAHMMALGPVIEEIRVTKMPEKTDYAAGELFEPEGMEVVAVYGNGTIRDISKYISYSTKPLSAKDSEFIIEFSHVMYQDKNGETGVEYTTPMTTINLAITGDIEIEDKEETEKTEVCQAFSDIKHGAWYEDGVQFVFDREIMKGTDGLFKPTDNITRKQLVTVLYRLVGSPKVEDRSAVSAFSDVPANAYYTDAVCWAYNENITTGSNGKFQPDALLTREQLATFLFRFADLMGYDVTQRGDYTTMLNWQDLHAYGKEAMSWAVGAGLITGSAEKDADGNTVYNLKPAAGATRAQIASILMRFSEANQ